MDVTMFALLAAISLLLMFAAIFVVALLLQRTRGQNRLRRRMETEVSAEDEFDDAPGERRFMRSVARGGKVIEDWVDPENEGARLLVQAGWRSEQARAGWYLLQSAIPLIGIVAVLAFWLFGPEKNKQMMLLCFAFAAFAFSILIPRWILRGAAAGRREKIKNEVPLFIHLLILLFEAGLSTRQAFASMVREGGGVLPELGGEFELVLRQLEAGADTSELLKSVSDALQVEDLASVLGVLRQVDRYGGEIREPLQEALGLLEERRGLDLREKVNLLSGRMTVVMVMFFFPALLIFVAGPAFVSVIKALDAAAK